MRRHQIQQRAEETGYSSAKSKTIFALETRESKYAIDEEKTDLAIREAAQKHGIDFAKLERQALERGPVVTHAHDLQRETKQALDYARDHNSERAAAFRQDQLISHALDRGMGKVSLEDVLRQVQQRRESGELLHRQEARTSAVLTTPEMVHKEETVLEKMQQSKAMMEPATQSSF